MKWEVGQTVDVQSRTWAGINKPGGCAKITKVHYDPNGLNVESIDVKYVLGGGVEKEIDPAIVSPFETLERAGRKRRGREFLMDRADDVVKKVKQVIGKKKDKAEGAAAKKTQPPPARRTKEPDQSTSPSTPITPEHPSVSKAKAAKKGVVTVPSFVIADRAVEVSPLPLDRSVAEPQTATTVARRGLFGSKKDKVDLPNAVDALDEFCRKEGIEVSNSFAKGETFLASAQNVSKAHSAAVKDSLMMKQGKSLSSNFGGTKKVPLADRKPAANPVSASTKKTTKASLKGVFDYELRKAREFLDEVCRAPCNDMDEVPDPACKENRLDTSGSEDEDDRKPAANDRRQEFLDLFRELRRKFDDDDGTMDETAFRALIDQRAAKPFSLKELDDNLEYLYQEGKLMKSDGILYIID